MPQFLTPKLQQRNERYSLLCIELKEKAGCLAGNLGDITTILVEIQWTWRGHLPDLWADSNPRPL